MKNVIIKNEDASYSLTSRGNHFTLIKTQWGWEMWTRNASTKAYSRGMPSIKTFDSLDDIESAYKSWQGIKLLIEAETC